MWFLPMLKLLGGIDIGGIAKTIAQAQAAKQDAGVKKEQIDADLVAKATELSVKEAELNTKIIVSEQGNILTRMVRPAIAFPFILYLYKVIIWDKLLAYGVTDSLGDSLNQFMALVLGSYFIGRTVEKTVSTLRRL